MTMEEFYDATNDIMQFYGKEINSFERNIWYGELKSLNVERYKRIIRHCFRTEKFMPKLADILKIKRELPAKDGNWDAVDCKHCKGTGLITYHKKDLRNDYDYFYACRCTCENGQRLSKGIPRVEEVNIF